MLPAGGGPGGDLGRPVVDKTGLTGRYDFSVQYSVAATRAAKSTSTEASMPAGIRLQDALQEQLGLKLIPSKAVVQLPVIDELRQPTDN